MSCYFRYMKDVLEEAGIVVDKKNKKDVDRIIHTIVDEEYKNCSQTWKKVKERIKGDAREREIFINELRQYIEQQ